MERTAPSSPGVSDALRRIVGWCADVCEANPHAVEHDGACGRRFFCPRHRDDGYRRAEVLDNGDLLLHCEGKRLRPSDLDYAERIGGLES